MKILVQILLLIALLQFSLIQGRILSEESTSKIKENICKIQNDETGIKGVDNVQSNQKLNEQTYKAKDLAFLKDAAEGKKYLREYLYEDKSDEDFLKDLLMDILPLCILLVLSVLGYMVYVVCYFIDCCCPSCNCCAKKNQKQSKREELSKKKKSKYTKAEMRWPIFGQLLFSIWVAAAGIVGIVIGSDFTNGYYQMSCQFASFLNDFDSGVESKGWYGLEKVKLRIKAFDDDFKTSVDETFKSQPWMLSGYQNLDTQGNDLWLTEGQTDSYYEYSVNPEGGSDLKSTFYNNLWGPNTNEVTYTANIKRIVQGPIRQVYDSMIEAQRAGEDLKTSDFSQAMKDGTNEVEDFQLDLLKISKDLWDFIDGNEDTLMPSIKNGINLYFIVSILIAALSFLSAILVGLTRCYSMRVCMHISWCVFSIWMIIGFTLSTGLYATSLIGVQSCDIIDDIRDDPKFLRNLDQDFLDESLIRKIEICNNNGKHWEGKGDIMKEFNIDQQLEDLRILNQEMSNSTKQNQDNEVEINKMNDYISQSKEQLTSMLNAGTYKSLADDSVIYEMNVGGNPGLRDDIAQPLGNDCGPAQDIFRDGDCTTTSSIEDVFGSNEASNVLCTNIHQYYNNGQRAYPPSLEYDHCFNSDSTVLGKNLMWVKDKNQISFKKQQEVVQFDTDFKAYQQNVNNWMEGIGNFTDQKVSGILDSTEQLVDQGINCLFVGDNINLIMDTVCDVLVDDIYWMGIILIIHNVGMFIGSIFLVCAGFRFANVLNKDQKKGYKKVKGKDRAKQYQVKEKAKN